MTLFVEGRLKAHSGNYLDEKIECEAFTYEDWNCLANMIARRLAPKFYYAVGVPRGGLELANALNALPKIPAGPRILIVDDVLTTGGSLLDMMAKYPNSLGYVVFDRSGKPLPTNVRALFTLNF